MESNLYDELKKKYSLTRKQFLSIFHLIAKRKISNVHAVPQPKAIILGAQPGAGKTELQKAAEDKLYHNTVICNADDLRDFHPKAPEIKSKYPELYPELTSGYAQKWNDALCQVCRSLRLNYILETTFSSGERLNDTIKDIKASHYKVDIMLLAVNPQLSLLGTYMRYEVSMETVNGGRKVSKLAHDQRFNAITGTIQAITKKPLFDDIYLYSRSIVVEYSDLIEGVTLIARNPFDILKIYKEEVEREWNPKLKEYFKTNYENVLEKMIKRGAPTSEIEFFKKELDLYPIQEEKQAFIPKRGRRM